MYTVIRFQTEQSELQRLFAFKEAFEAKLGLSSSDSLDYVENRFSIDVSSQDVSGTHINELESFLKKHFDDLSKFSQSAGKLFLDVAIEPEDLEGRVLLELEISSSLTTLIADLGIFLSISIYPGRSTEDSQ